MQKMSKIKQPGERGFVHFSLKQRNCNAILNAVFRSHPISRSAICDLTGLTPATVSSLTQTLMGAGVTRFNGEGVSIGGRRPMLIDLNPSAFYIAAVDLGITKLIGAIIDLSGNIICSDRTAIDIHAGSEPIIEKMITSLKYLMANVDKEILRKTLAIGLSLPGVVDEI